MSLHRRKMHFMAGAIVLVLTGVAVSASPREDAQRILEAAGVEGGLVVHLGCGDGSLTAALGAGDGFLVQGLDADPANVRQARAHIRSEGQYGRVSVERLSGDRLPYIDDLANLVVVSDRGNVPMDEIMRVLAPLGVAYVKEGEAWKKRIKPRPDALDVWTHYLYDATNNAVAHDTVVGPPRRTQWTGGPRWARHHDHMASMSAMVATDRRVFTIMDEGSVASIRLPANWYLSARDAFNGTLLWKRAIPDWWPHLYPLKSGPGLLPRRLVAVGGEVYVTLGLAAPLSALDAATGKTLRTYEGTKGTEEVLHCDGLLFVVCNPALPNGLTDFAQSNSHCWTAQRQRSNQFGWHGEKKRVMGIETDSGKVLWKHTEPVGPLTLAADGKRVYYMRQDRIVARDPKSGKELWASDTVPVRKVIGTGFGPTLVIHKGVVLFYGGQKHTLVGLDAETGKKLWEGKLPPSGHFCPEDVLCVGGLAWAADIAGARNSGTFIGRDVRSGEVAREVPQDVNNNLFVMHQRCYRSKATVNWLIPPRIGTEFVDFRKEHWNVNHWVRGGCIYGIVPCNGLLYATPHSCACYMQSKLSGFYALGPAAKKKRAEPSDEERLEKGPAYGSAISNLKSETSKADWPTYRHDSLRSGHTASAVPADLQRAWQTDLGGRLSAVTAAGGRLYVASVETHTVHALDARTGKPAWSYTAGGRVDSPPTIWNGRALFGSADGHIYCLRASDGELLWRFRAAPHADTMVAYDQVESVWPVHGSVLVQDGVIYAVAGRCMFLDGGMRLLRLDAKTGRKISETVLDDRVPGTGEDLYTKMRHKQLPVALPDILSSEPAWSRAAPTTRAARACTSSPPSGSSTDPGGTGPTGSGPRTSRRGGASGIATAASSPTGESCASMIPACTDTAATPST